MISTIDQLNIIIGISTFLGGLILTFNGLGTEDKICKDINCEVFFIIRTTTGLSWLLSLSISTYLYLSNNKKEKFHKWNIYILIISMVLTILFVSIQSIIRIINNNMLSGFFIIYNILLFISIFVLLIYKYRELS